MTLDQKLERAIARERAFFKSHFPSANPALYISTDKIEHLKERIKARDYRRDLVHQFVEWFVGMALLLTSEP